MTKESSTSVTRRHFAQGRPSLEVPATSRKAIVRKPVHSRSSELVARVLISGVFILNGRVTSFTSLSRNLRLRN